MNAACRYAGELEAYVFGELPEARATAVLLHLAACEACSAEAKLLRAERRAFRERAADVAHAVPSFAGVLERLEKDPPPVRLVTTRDRFMIAGALAAAAGFALFFASTREPASTSGAPAIVEVSNESCWDGEPNEPACASVASNAGAARAEPTYREPQDDYRAVSLECVAAPHDTCEVTPARDPICCDEEPEARP